MATNDRPKARQSQLVTTYGVGSLFPAGDQSFMIAGIDDWDESWSPVIEEPRLARSLGVHTFRAPATGKRSGDVPAIRFPTYHYCPECRRLGHFWEFDAKRMRCDDCGRDLTPSRFVACCENGHIEDFPYFQWVHRGSDTTGRSHRMSLETQGASSSLADIVIKCSCGVRPHDMDGSLSRGALTRVKGCAGKRPWLPSGTDETCDMQLRALQRGSSNVWFAAVRSSISIPPWSSPNAQFVTKWWTALEHAPDGVLPAMVTGMLGNEARPGVDKEQIVDLVRQRKGLQDADAPSEQDLREEEYRALIAGNEGGSHDTFHCVQVDVDAAMVALVAQVSKVSRLREVRALHGFSRISPMPTDTTNPRLAKLSEAHKNWLPATEVLGEGIFLKFDEVAITAFEEGTFVTDRHAMLAASLEGRSAESGAPPIDPPGARFILIHSLAHALLQELSLDAGYPVGSLRERIYAAPGQAGILIYTASSDAAGSLGGLAALASPDRLAAALFAAASRAAWCSNDPVCSESGLSGTDGLNLSACHACLLLPETSCEHRNIYLDRVALVGSMEFPEPGLMSGLAGAS